VHTRSVLGLDVAPSRIPKAGLGLFAVRAFKKGQNIVEYCGEKMSTADYDAKYASDAMGAYGIELDGDYVLDASATSSGVARYACDYHGSNKRGPNAQYESDGERVWIVALRDIKPGDEIYTDYGDDMHRAIGIV
jgi:SET domain-containing protein